MNKSESIKELAAALAKAQGKIKGALKDQSNPFFKSKYADLASVVEAIREPLSTNGLSYVQLTEPSDKDEVRVETILMHSSGEWIGSVLALPVTKADAQGFGSALTYARRYGLSAAVGVAPEDDDGNSAAKAAPRFQGNVTSTAGAKDRLSPGQRESVDKVAGKVRDWLAANSIADAVTEADNAALDADEYVYFWTYFDSKERSEMKKQHDLDKANKATTQTADATS